MKIPGRFTLPLLAIALASCASQPEAPNPQPTGEIWRAWNTPDGEVHTERVRDLTPEEAASPTTTTITAGKRGASQAAPATPPEVEIGKTVAVDWKGTGMMTGEVLDMRGHWVKLRFTITDKADPSVSAGADAWVNFDKLTYYMAPREKKK